MSGRSGGGGRQGGARGGRRRGDGDAASGVRTCDSCGREMAARRRWAGGEDAVRWCSDACRRRKVTDVDRRLEATILDLLARRAGGATICPSEAARAVGGDDEAGWRPLMEPARRAARRLVAAGELEITQGGRVVDPSTAKGPIRLRRP